MRVYLLDGSCGNTIARLYTNLQHYYDSQVTIEWGREDYFEPQPSAFELVYWDVQGGRGVAARAL